MQYAFGSGSLFAIPAGANPTPVQFGALQDVSVDFNYSVKELRGQFQFPLMIARGAGKIDWKCKAAKLYGAAMNSLFFNGTNAVGLQNTVVDESGTVAGTTITVANSATWLTDLGLPDAGQILTGEQKSPYLLTDMARDGAELVRFLGLGPVHVVGVSMGGMVAQQFAIDHPDLTRTLTSIMSTPHANEVGQPTPEAMTMLLTPRSDEFEAFMVQEIEAWRLTSGPDYPIDEAWVRQQAEASWTRGRNPEGVMRQMAAIVQSPDRRPLLANVHVPAMVLHGESDPLVTISGGEATAAALPNATFVRYPGLGHSVPEELWSEMIGRIYEVSQRA